MTQPMSTQQIQDRMAAFEPSTPRSLARMASAVRVVRKQRQRSPSLPPESQLPPKVTISEQTRTIRAGMAALPSFESKYGELSDLKFLTGDEVIMNASTVADSSPLENSTSLIDALKARLREMKPLGKDPMAGIEARFRTSKSWQLYREYKAYGHTGVLSFIQKSDINMAGDFTGTAPEHKKLNNYDWRAKYTEAWFLLPPQFCHWAIANQPTLWVYENKRSGAYSLHSPDLNDTDPGVIEPEIYFVAITDDKGRRMSWTELGAALEAMKTYLKAMITDNGGKAYAINATDEEEKLAKAVDGMVVTRTARIKHERCYLTPANSRERAQRVCDGLQGLVDARLVAGEDMDEQLPFDICHVGYTKAPWQRANEHDKHRSGNKIMMLLHACHKYKHKTTIKSCRYHSVARIAKPDLAGAMEHLVSHLCGSYTIYLGCNAEYGGGKGVHEVKGLDPSVWKVNQRAIYSNDDVSGNIMTEIEADMVRCSSAQSYRDTVAQYLNLKSLDEALTKTNKLFEERSRDLNEENEETAENLDRELKNLNAQVEDQIDLARLIDIARDVVTVLAQDSGEQDLEGMLSQG